MKMPTSCGISRPVVVLLLLAAGVVVAAIIYTRHSWGIFAALQGEIHTEAIFADKYIHLDIQKSGHDNETMGDNQPVKNNDNVLEKQHKDHRHKISENSSFDNSRSLPPAGIKEEIVGKKHNNKHVVLIWTPFFVDKTWSYRSGKDPFKNTFCNYDNCQVTYDKSKYVSADVILFHCRDDVGDWPASRPRDQLYGVFCLESPSYSQLGQYGDRLNLTLTYRRDADVFTPYHQVIARRDVINVTDDVRSGRPVVPLANRSHDVLWPVSHCITNSKREKYAKELGKYIKVDIYGNCGPNKCPINRQVSPPDDSVCEAIFKNQYKFLLSFENSYCKDYITEKFFKAFWLELIPIVFGNTDYKQYYPPHSFIDVRDYKSPEHLSEHLRYLTQNETAFNEYFAWKQSHEAPRAYWFESLYCGVCRIMNNDSYRNTYPDPKAWWADNTCDNGIIARMQNTW